MAEAEKALETTETAAGVVMMEVVQEVEGGSMVVVMEEAVAEVTVAENM